LTLGTKYPLDEILLEELGGFFYLKLEFFGEQIEIRKEILLEAIDRRMFEQMCPV
jgi:hypothetical protein